MSTERLHLQRCMESCIESGIEPCIEQESPSVSLEAEVPEVLF